MNCLYKLLNGSDELIKMKPYLKDEFSRVLEIPKKDFCLRILLNYPDEIEILLEDFDIKSLPKRFKVNGDHEFLMLTHNDYVSSRF